MAHETPFLKAVTLTNANTNYCLATLLNALDADVAATSISSRCQYLQLQFDVDAGADVLRIGNVDVSDTNFGVELVGSQAWTIQSMNGNLIHLGFIYLRSNGAGHKVYVAMLSR